VAFECAYNMLHLTPVQTLGVSNSRLDYIMCYVYIIYISLSYCIADHMELNPFFKGGDMGQLKTMVDQWEKEWNMLTMQDVRH
jgi:hypothetical protein